MALTMDVSTTSRAPSEQNGLECLQNDEEVEEHGRVLDVEKVVLQLLERVLRTGAVGVAHLCPARDAGPHHMPLTVVRDLFRQFGDELRTLRPRPDQAHLAAQHV